MIEHLSDQLESYAHEVYSVASYLATQKKISLSDALKCVEIATRDMAVDSVGDIAKVLNLKQVGVNIEGRLENLNL